MLFFQEYLMSFECELGQITFLHEDEAPSEEWTPSGCCSRREYVRPRAAFRQRSNAADQEEFLPCPGSWS